MIQVKSAATLGGGRRHLSESEIKYHAIVHVGRWYTLQGFLQFSPTNLMLVGFQDHSGEVAGASGQLEVLIIGPPDGGRQVPHLKVAK